MQGSATSQCDKQTGKCVCRKGVTGDKCDACERGTIGDLPNCQPCGECYDDWSRAIDTLNAELSELKQSATDHLLSADALFSPTTADGKNELKFSEQYAAFDKKVSDARKIVETTFTDRQLKSLNEKLTQIEYD